MEEISLIIQSENLEKLYFPEALIKELEILLEDRYLKIAVDKAWLDINGGIDLGEGILIFTEWKKIKIKRYDHLIKNWIEIDLKYPIEPLKDLCEFSFSKEEIYLRGFGSVIGQWMEWKIEHAKIYAKFES